MQENLEHMIGGLIVVQTMFNFYVANKTGLINFDNIKKYISHVKKVFNPEKSVSRLQKYNISPILNQYNIL